ncbi:SH2 domain-containing protein 1A-like isoform X2 [Hippocampus zosterae]|uniref:SH2 domain-containing protein 1A-like isoform X2 n=1 Tax=Hippocampus zosterae TaxID=109293 RepID=UPI00223E4F15|nr:SH2 domain-containing protein 1A-like isoform X2 [Hippocampus zosterae]
MENLSVYHGPIGKKEGERRLGLDGRDGCFLVRNSDSVPDVYCLCVLSNGIVFTYRLQQHDGGSWAAEVSSSDRDLNTFPQWCLTSRRFLVSRNDISVASRT